MAELAEFYDNIFNRKIIKILPILPQIKKEFYKVENKKNAKILNKDKTPLDYSIVIKKHLDFMVITIPDLQINHIEELPKNGRIDGEFLGRITSALNQCWAKAQGKLKSFESANLESPSPSLIRSTISMDLTPQTQMEFTAPEAARFLGCSENTVRRAIKSGKLRCRLSPGGHRRLLREDLDEFRQDYQLDKNSLETSV